MLRLGGAILRFRLDFVFLFLVPVFIPTHEEANPEKAGNQNQYRYKTDVFHFICLFLPLPGEKAEERR